MCWRVEGYHVGGKTGTANKNINGKYTSNKLTSFISIFSTNKPKFLLLVLIDEPKKHLISSIIIEGRKFQVNRNDLVGIRLMLLQQNYKKIRPILAINKNDFYDNHVVKKSD